MKLYNIIRKNLSLLALPALLISLGSCSSYQYSGYEPDGIYGEARPGIWEQETPQNNEVRPNNNNSYYQNLFAQQSDMYGEILESEVFTDVENYSSNDGYENYNETGGDVAYVGGNAPWGQDLDTYTINIYNNNNMFGGFYAPWRYGWGNNFFPYYGGFYDPFYFPYARPWGYAGAYWNIGFGFNFPYYGYRGFYGPMYYNNFYYGYRPYHRNRVAYNLGHRNSRVYYSEGVNRRNSSSDRVSSYSRSIREIRNSGVSNRTSRVGSSATRSNDGQIYTRTNRRSQSTRSYDYGQNTRTRSSSPNYQRSSRNSNSTYRSSPSRRSNSSSRPSSVRSSGSSRSSGTTTRSSGGSSRSSRGGRGN